MSIEIREIEVREIGDITVLKVPTLTSEIPIGDKIRELVARGCTMFVIESGKYSNLDSGGCYALIVASSRVSPLGGWVKVLRPNNRVRHVMGVTKTTNFIPILETEPWAAS